MQPKPRPKAVLSQLSMSQPDSIIAGLSLLAHNQICCSDCYSVQYRHRKTDIPEKGLEVIGENIPEDDISEDSDDSIPIRVLTNLVVYHQRTRELVSLARLQESLSEYEVVGDVSPLPADEDEVDEELDSSSPDDVQRIMLEDILDFDFHHLDESGLDWLVFSLLL